MLLRFFNWYCWKNGKIIATTKLLNFDNLINISGEVIKHNDLRVIHGEGMPHHRNPDEKGDLIINFKVNFPEKIAQKNIEALSQLLPGKV